MAGLSVLLTCAGGLVAPGIIRLIKDMPEVERVVAANASDEAIGFYFADEHHVIPMGDSPGYADALLQLCRDEDISVVIPASDEEVGAVSVARNRFVPEVGVVCSSGEATTCALDKGDMLSFLKARGIAVPDYSLPVSKEELVRETERLGYPNRPVVAKPRRGRGGRGVRILEPRVDVAFGRSMQGLKLEWYVDSIRDEDVEKIILMEHLPGADYSIDTLSRQGELVGVAPRRRLTALGGPSQTGEVVQDESLTEQVGQIVKAFGFDSLANIQLKENADGVPCVYEINPRISGTIAAASAAGTCLLEGAIRQAAGLPVMVERASELKMVRYLKEFYIRSGEE